MEIRPYQPGDEKEIAALFLNAFGKPMPQGFWQWRYQKNPFLSDVLIHMMWDGNTLAGHYAVSPVEMIAYGKKTLTALSMTTMTHSSYAGRGIFSTLAESLYKEAYEKYQVQMVWGFPNANSHYGFIKNLGWKDVATVPFLTLKITDTKPYQVSGFRIVDSVDDKKVTALAVHHHFPISINKTVKYLQWRYVENPTCQYQILELDDAPDCFIIFKIIKSFSDSSLLEADVVEFGCNDPDACKKLVSALITYSVQSGKPITKINTWESLFSKKHIWLEKLRFGIGSPVTFLGARAFEKGMESAYDFREWEIGLGYSDVF